MPLIVVTTLKDHINFLSNLGYSEHLTTVNVDLKKKKEKIYKKVFFGHFFVSEIIWYMGDFISSR
jgi:hypothetical protein